MKGCSGFIGTSNPHLAIKHNIKPVGTSAHEMIMGMAGLYGASLANRKYLDCWRNFYGNDLSIALTDTYTTDAFLKAFTFKDATEWGGLRQDSGDCDEWASKIINHYNKLEIPLEDKTLLFSDSLNDEKYKKLSLKYRNVARIVGGIGTDFSNYCSDKSPLNMVIKLTSINGTSVVKLSDDLKKSTGNVDSVRKIKEELNII
jgi:nicotinate phosphoribosyltransferase